AGARVESSITPRRAWEPRGIHRFGSAAPRLEVERCAGFTAAQSIGNNASLEVEAPRFRRSEPKASGQTPQGSRSITELEAPIEANHAAPPAASRRRAGSPTRLAVDHEARSRERTQQARFRRSEPKASGPFTKLAVDPELEAPLEASPAADLRYAESPR